MNKRQDMFALAMASGFQIGLATTPIRKSTIVRDGAGREYELTRDGIWPTARTSEEQARLDALLFGIGFYSVEHYSLDSTCEIWRHRDGGAR